MEGIKDLVSVIIPTYNRAHLIKRSAESVLNQTYFNLELIIVDDGSTDNTEEVVKTLDDERVIYIKQPNQGACAARNNGIDHAKGEFIAFQDSDDVWHEDKLEKQIKCLRETGADLVLCNRVVCQNELKDSENHIFNKGFLERNTLPYGICPQMFLGASTIFKKNKFDIEMPRYQDFELLLRLQKKCRIYYDEDPLVDYYMQEDSISTNNKKLLKAWNLILTKHSDFLIRYKDYLPYLAYATLTNSFKSEDKQTQKELAALAFRFSNSIKLRIKNILFNIHILDFCTPIYRFLRFNSSSH